jgi:tetratricopeptide (TPR) repeat protein
VHSDPPSSFFPSRGQWIGAAILFLLVGLLVFGGTLGYGFIVLDDPFVIYNNLAIRAINAATLRHIFTTFDPELYIPLTFLSFQLNYLMGGLSPLPYHLTNLLLHVANALMVAWIIGLLLRHRGIGMFAGLLFLIHPMNVEVVAWATARKEALSTFFALMTILGYLRYRENGSGRAYALSIVAFLLALLAKVSVFSIPILLLLIDFLDVRKWNRKMLTEKIPHIIIAGILVLVGIIPKRSIIASTTLLEKVLMAGKSTVFYLWKFIVPSGLSVLYPNSGAISIVHPEFFVPLIIVALLAVLLLLSLKRTRTVAFGALFFLIAISPTYVHFNRNAMITSGTATGVQFASDHYAYFPSIGLLFLAASLGAWLWNRPLRYADLRRNRNSLLGAGAIILIILGIISWNQTTVWASNESLFSNTLALYPYSAAARVNLSVIYRQTERFDLEKSVLKDGLAYGQNSKLLTGLGTIAAREGDETQANLYFDQAIATDPTNSEPYFSRGAMESDMGKKAAAIKSYGQALALDPGYVDAYVNRGSLLLSEGNDAAAKKDFQRAVDLNPASKEAQFNLGAMLLKEHDPVGATAAFEQVIALDPTLIEARLELVPLYLEKGRNTAALDQVKAILAQDPNNEAAKSLIKEMMRLGIVGKK